MTDRLIAIAEVIEKVLLIMVVFGVIYYAQTTEPETINLIIGE